jgi:predicted ATPase/DNA-binding SARP family transcriptional activator
MRAHRGAASVEKFRTQKTAALLALLALGATRSREEVCVLLWPDSAPEAARNSLSAALSALRKDFGEDVLQTDRYSVALAPGCFSTDIAAFSAALKQKDFAAAVDIYKGHLLPGFHEDPFPSLSGAYREKAHGAFVSRLKELLALQDADALRSLARRAISIFGDEETWFVALMRAHQMNGDWDAALRTYEALLRFARKNGELAGIEARSLAKSVRREKEQSQSLIPQGGQQTGGRQQSSCRASPQEAADNSPDASFPVQWTRFFGREAEQDMLRHWLRSGQKLITLSGAGGSGKTRLAIETIRSAREEWNDTFFVPLAPLTDPSLLHSAIRDALGFAAAPDLPPLDQLERTFRGRKILLLLDNFEQLVEGGAALLQTLREKLPEATLVVTSRVLLNLPGEREFPVAPLPTPLRSTSPDAVRECPSAALFCDRSAMVVDSQNSENIGALCRRLDGIPLALELAAARARMLTPAEILQRLEQHPDFLQSRELGVPPRHKTLRATIEWSVDLLAPEVREFFCHLSIFRGGFSLEAAENIVAPGICAEWETIDFLEQLRSHSLLQTMESPAGTRYRLLEMLREWAQSQVSDAEKEALQRRHLDFYLAQADASRDFKVLIKRQLEMEADIANFRAALSSCISVGDSRSFARLVTSLCGFWELRSHFSEACGWARRALEKSEELAPDERASLLRGAGSLFWYGGDLRQAKETLSLSVSLYEQLDDEAGLAHALDMYGKAQMVRAECEGGRQSGERAAAIARLRGDTSRLASSLITQAWGLTNTRRPLESNELLEEALAIANSIGEPRLLALCHGSRTLNFWGAGDEETARAGCRDLVAACERTSNAYARGFAHGVVTLVGCGLNDWEMVRPVLPGVTREHFAIGTRWEFINLFFVAARFSLRRNDLQRAALLYAAAQMRCDMSGYCLVPCLADFALSGNEFDALCSSPDGQANWARGKFIRDEEVVSLIEEMCQ